MSKDIVEHVGTTGIKQVIAAFRQSISETATGVRAALRRDLPNNWPAHADLGEFNANIMLAYRHLEDARMRLGKAIQAFDGGVSVYDNQPTKANE